MGLGTFVFAFFLILGLLVDYFCCQIIRLLRYLGCLSQLSSVSYQYCMPLIRNEAMYSKALNFNGTGKTGEGRRGIYENHMDICAPMLLFYPNGRHHAGGSCSGLLRRGTGFEIDGVSYS